MANPIYTHRYTNMLQDNEPIISKGFEESEEVDPEKSRLVCSDNHTAKPQELSKKKKKK